MQRLLTEEEYQELVSRGEKAVDDQVKLVQTLCTMVAETKPIKYWGNEEARIWGCIHNISSSTEGYYDLSSDEQDAFDEKFEEEHPTTEYCGECPVQDKCPSRKSWSQ